ncbi:MAG: fibronectin type III domain-containing protein [Nitrospirae bacterium]|nr:fibronectin type III domain-containing protein [Nitrospirota bacterium]
MKQLQEHTAEGLSFRMKGMLSLRSHGRLGIVLLCFVLSSCFGNSSNTTEVKFRLANGSSVTESELSLVKIRLYGEDDRFPFAYATDAAKVCSQKPEDLATDSPLYEQEFDYNAHSARILATLPDGKINIVLEFYRKQTNPDKSEDLVLVARGTRSGVPVALSGNTDVGDIKFVDVLDSVRPAGVTVLGRTKKVDVSLKATPAATDYIVCYGTSATSTMESAVFTQPSGTIDSLGGEPLQDDTQYSLRVYARNDGSLSLPALRSSTAPVDPKTSPTESEAVVFTATTTQQIAATVQAEVSTGKAILSWDAVTGATGYCIDSPCFDPTNTTCTADPSKAVASPTSPAKLTDAAAQTHCKSGSGAARRCYTVTDIVSGRDCAFNIYALGPDNGMGDPQSVTFRSLAPPRFIDARARSGSITLNWSASEGADDYVVLINNGRSGEPYDCKINDFKGKLTASLNESVLVPPAAVCTTTQTVTPGKTYYLSLQAKALGTNISSPSPEVFVTPLAPLAATLAKAGTGKIRVMWSTATDAAGYLVYYTTSASDLLFAGSGLTEGDSPLCVEKEKGRSECKGRPKGKESKLVPTTVSETVAGKTTSLNMIEITPPANGAPYFLTVTSFSNDPKTDSDNAEPEKELLDEAESDPAPKLSVTPLAPPTGVKVNAGDASVRLAWSPVTGADAYCAQSDCLPGAPKCTDALTQNLANEIGDKDAMTCPVESSGRRCLELKNLTNGAACAFQVFAMHGATDLSDPSAALSGTPVATPKDVAAAGSTGQATLTWPSAIVGAQGVEVQYDKDQSGVPYQFKQSFSGAGLKQATVTGLTNGVQHYFVVQGSNTSNGLSPASAEVTTLPLAAPVISIQSGTQTVTVAWTAVTGATEYEIHYDTDNGNEPFIGTGAAAGNSPVTKTDAASKAACPAGSADTLRCAPLTGLTNGQKYYVAAKATQSTLRSVSSLSNAKSTQPIPTPTNVRLNAVSDATSSSVQLSWDAATGATGYRVYHDTNPLKPPLKQGTKLTPTGTATTLLISGLTANTAYYFSVEALNAEGSSDASAAYLAATRLDTPTGVRARGGTARAAVSWSPVTGGSNYRVYWDPVAGKASAGTSVKPPVLSTCALPVDALCPGGTSACCGIVCGDDASGCAAPNLVNGSATYFAVRAEKAACAAVPPVDLTNNCSGYSTCSTASNSCAPPESKAVPVARPSDFKVLSPATLPTGNVTSSRIDIGWTPPGGSITGYKLYYDLDAPGTPYTGTGATQGFSPILLANSLSSLQLTGLTSNQTYFASLTAYIGNSNDPDSESDHWRTTLAAAAGAADDVLKVDSVAGFPAANIRLRIDSEYIVCTGTNPGATPDEFTGCLAGRGKFGTAAAAHSIGALVHGDLFQATLMPSPTTVSLNVGTGKAKLTWSAVTGASNYEVYCGSKLEGTQPDVPYDDVLNNCNASENVPKADVVSPTVQYLFTGLDNGTSTAYRFAVRAKTAPDCAPGPPTEPPYENLTSSNNCGDLSSLTNPLLSGTPLAAPAPAVLAQAGNQISLSWPAVSKAGGYRIYYWTAGSPNCAAPAVPNCPSPGDNCGPFSVSGTPCSTVWNGTGATQGASPILLCNGPTTTLAAAALGGDTELQVNSLSGFTVPTTLKIELEEISCTGTNSSSSPVKFTGCSRGANGTAAAAHALNTEVATASATSMVLTGLVPDIRYWVTMTTVKYSGSNCTGTLMTESDLAGAPTGVFKDTTIPQPTGVIATFNEGTSVVDGPNYKRDNKPHIFLSWNAEPAATSYRIFYDDVAVCPVGGSPTYGFTGTLPNLAINPNPPAASPISYTPPVNSGVITVTLTGAAYGTTYTFGVQTVSGASESTPACDSTGSPPGTVITPIAAPPGIAIAPRRDSPGAAIFSWATVPTADSYVIYYGPSTDNYTCTGPPDPSCQKATALTPVADINCAGTSSKPLNTPPPVDMCNGTYTGASFTGFSTSIKYYFSLTSKNEDGSGDYSNEMTFLPIKPTWATPPMQSVTGTSIRLLWTRNGLATDYEIHYDTAARDTDTNSSTNPPTTAASPYLGAAGLTPTAAPNVGLSWAANLNTALASAITNTDTNVTVANIGNAGTFNLPVDVSIESEILSCPTVNVLASRFEGCLRGQQSTAAAAHSGGVIVSAGPCRDTNSSDSLAECVIGGLTPGTVYYFAVRIDSSGGKSSFSDEKRTLSTATLKNPIPATGQVKLEWSTVAGADQYKVGRSTATGACNADFGGVTCPSTTVAGQAPSFPQTLSGLTNGTQYFFVVRAENSTDGSISPNSTEKTAKPLAAPTLSASSGTQVVRLSWVDITGAGQYMIGRATAGPGTCSTWQYKIGPDPPADPAPAGCTALPPVPDGAPTPMPQTQTPLTDGTLYYFVTRAEDTVNNGASDWSNEIQAKPVAKPTVVSAVGSTSQVKVYWSSPVAGADSIEISRYLGAGCSTIDSTNSVADSSPAMQVAANAVLYSFSLVANNNASGTVGTSSTSTCVEAMPLSIPANPAAAAGSLTATVNWDSVVGATGYRIYYDTPALAACPTPGGPPVPKNVGTASCGAPPCDDTVASLSGGVNYDFYITATGTNSESSCSAKVSATPLYGEVTGAPFDDLAPMPSSPLGVNLDPGDAIFEILVGSTGASRIYAKKGNNLAVDLGGWPPGTKPAGAVQASAAVAELDSSSADQEVAIAADDATIRIYRRTGAQDDVKAIAGAAGLSTPAIADIDGDGDPEIVIVAKNGAANSSLHLFDVNPATGVMTEIVAGFPIALGDLVATGAPVRGVTPALVNLDGVAGSEIVVGDASGNIHFIDSTGSETAVCAGFPLTLAASPLNVSPAVGDIDGDNPLFLEAVIANDAGTVFVVNDSNGASPCAVAASRTLAGAGPFRSSPVIADLDTATPGLEVVIAGADGKLYVLKGTNLTDLNASWTNGKLLSAPATAVLSSAAIADVNNDTDLEIVIGDSNAKLHALNWQDATELPGFPTLLNGAATSSPAVGNFDNVSTTLEIAIGDDVGKLHVFQVTGLSGIGALPWPTFHKNATRTGN